MHTETCNLARTDLLMNPDLTTKAKSVWLYCTGQNCPPNRHFMSSEPHSPWDICFSFYYYYRFTKWYFEVWSCQISCVYSTAFTFCSKCGKQQWNGNCPGSGTF